LLILVGIGLAGAALAAGTSSKIADPAQARSDYVENCGGCHGITGDSAPALLPVLRDRVG
jgi:mono/diheme cytochrome c family protein